MQSYKINNLRFHQSSLSNTFSHRPGGTKRPLPLTAHMHLCFNPASHNETLIICIRLSQYIWLLHLKKKLQLRLPDYINTAVIFFGINTFKLNRLKLADWKIAHTVPLANSGKICIQLNKLMLQFMRLDLKILASNYILWEKHHLSIGSIDNCTLLLVNETKYTFQS